MMTDIDIKKAGLKVTGPRVKILEILENAGDRHLSAEDIYQLLKEEKLDVSFATVYRVLAQFEVAGLVMRHRFDEDYSVFELNLGEHHDHLVCDKCGSIEEFSDEVVEKRQRLIAKQAGYKITGHALYIYGLCRACQSKNA